MRGWRVERRFGWDCHGLPAEMEAVKELGLPDAERHRTTTASTGSTTTAAPRCCVTRANGNATSTRQARWVDFSNDYKTMDLSYMESVMWAFKQLHKKGLLYEGYQGAAVLLGVRDASVQFRDPPGQCLPVPPGPGCHGRFRAGSAARRGARSRRSSRPGYRCVRWFGRPLRGHCLPTWPWQSGLTSGTPCCRPGEARYLVARHACRRWPMSSKRRCRARSGWPR